MSKVPVQKTVVRDGKVHTQTYWEGTDAQCSGAAALSGLRPTLAPQQPIEHDPVADAWSLVEEQPWTEACIAAGILPEAAKEMLQRDPHLDLTEFVYANALDQMPHPKKGWGVVFNQDCRRGWELAIRDSRGEITWEDAVAWSDAGFTYPWSRTAMLIQSGVAVERAAQWREALGVRPTEDTVGLYVAELLTEDLSYEEAREWRTAFSHRGLDYHPLSQGQLDFRAKGFAPGKAKAWISVLTSDVPAEVAVELQRLKWSPTSIKKYLNTLGKASTLRNYSLGLQYAQELIAVTEAVGGPKKVNEWAEAVSRKWGGYGDPDAVPAVQAAEAWIAQVKDETGVELGGEDSRLKVLNLSAPARGAFVALAKAVDGGDYGPYLDFAQRVGTPENVRFLQENGFPLQTDMPHITGMGNVWKSFDPATASKPERDRWLRDLAVDLYWRGNGSRESKYSFLPNADKRQIAADETIDPIALKDTLLASGGRIDRVQLEGILSGGISSSVSDGWL